MNFIGDYFALGLIIILALFFFDGKHALNKASKLYMFSLLMTAVTAAIDILTGELMLHAHLPLWIHIAVNSLYFLVGILTTTGIALYLIAKILEHSHVKRCMVAAQIGLAVCLFVYIVIILLNLKTGWLFYFNEQGAYCRGPLNALGYFVTLCQMALVLICYFFTRHNASISLRWVLSLACPLIVICIVLQRLYPDIMLNSFVMAMVHTILFLTYKSQRQGIHVLTKLNDRHRFFESIHARINARSPFQVFLINLKNYGIINQKYGHIIGDEVLHQFAFGLERLFKSNEAFHMNGTVFALLLPYYNQHTAEKHLSDLIMFLEGGVSCSNELIHLEYVAVEYLANEDEANAEDFYEKLEYAAAKAYKNKEHFIHYTPALGLEMYRKRYLIERLQTVDREHGYQVWYQPIKCLANQEFCSMEALIRLMEPDGSIISPAEFIPLAEETGMLVPVTWFVLEETCRLLHEHPEIEANVSINLPMSQLMSPSFLVRLNSIVDSYNLSHRRIVLEFTERSILENFDQVRYVMHQVCKAGYRFFLDDFGSGYSNFNCLLQLPFELVKLDAALIRMDLGNEGQQNLGLTERLIPFIHDNHMQVIAEGVETEALAQVLHTMHIDRIQGYVYAKPMPQDKLIQFYQDLSKEN